MLEHVDAPSSPPLLLQALEAKRNWVLMLIGTLVAAMSVVALWYLGNYLSSPAPYLSGSTRLQHEYDEAKSQAEAIRASLEQVKVEEQLKREEEARQRLQEQTESGMDVVIDAEAQAAAATAVMEQTFAATKMAVAAGELPKETEKYLRETVATVSQQAAPILARAGHVYSVLQDESDGVRERLIEFAKGEAVALTVKLQAAVELPEEQLPLLEKLKVPDVKDLTQMLQGKTGDLTKMLQGKTADWELPPISLFVAAIFAPAQLNWVLVCDRLHVCVSGVMVAVTLGCVITAWGRECGDVLVRVWAWGYLTLSALDVLLRCINMQRVAAGLAKLKEDDTQKPALFSTGNAIWDTFLQMQFQSDTCFRAFFKWNDVASSWVFFASRALGGLIMVWNLFGLCTAMANAVDESLHCEAKALVLWMRIRSFFFVLLLFWTLTQTVLTLIVRLHVVEKAIMEAAVRADANSEVPIFAILARSLLMQEQRVELRIREAMIQEEIKVLQEEQVRSAAETRAFEEKLEKRAREAEKIHEARLREEAATNAERVDRCVKLAHAALSKAEPFVAIAASKLEQPTERGGAGAAAARLSESEAAASSTP